MVVESCSGQAVYRLHIASWIISEGWSLLVGWRANTSVNVSIKSVLSHTLVYDFNYSSAGCQAGGHKVPPPHIAHCYERLGSWIAHFLRLLEILSYVFCAPPIPHSFIAVRQWYTIIMRCCFLWLVHVSWAAIRSMQMCNLLLSSTVKAGSRSTMFLSWGGQAEPCQSTDQI